jgi:hypothetical protein
MEPHDKVWYDNEVTFQDHVLRSFNPRIGKYQIDCVTTSKTAAALQLQRLLYDHRCGEDMIPVFTHELKVVAEGFAHQTVNDLEVTSRLMSYWATYPIFDTELERGYAIKESMKYLQPMLAKKIMDKSKVFPCGLSCREIDAAVKDVPKHEKFTAFFGGRLNFGSKRAVVSLELMENFFAFGRDVKIIASTPSSTTAKAFAGKFSALELFDRVPTWEFWKKAAACHTFISFSRMEGFTVGVVEMLYMGLIGVLPNTHWVKGLLLDRFDDYPFKHRNETEALACLRYIYENLEEAKKKIAWVPDFIRERYDAWKVNQAEYKYMQSVVEGTRRNYLWSPGNVDLMQQTSAAMPGAFTLDEFWAVMLEKSEAYRDGTPVRGKLSKWAVRQWLMHNGYRDTYASAEPAFEKVSP